MERYSAIFYLLSTELLLAVLAIVKPQSHFITVPNFKAHDRPDSIRTELEKYVEENGDYSTEELDAAIVKALDLRFTYCNNYGPNKDEKGWKHILYNFGISINGQVYETKFMMGLAHTSTPTIEQVFDSLISDSECVEYCENIDEFYIEFGYDSIIAAQTAFSACNQINRFLKIALS